MKDSQQEIKSTVTVNTSDIAAKAHEDKEQSKDLEKLAKKRGGKFLVTNCHIQSGTWPVVL
jgi:inositol 1,4,5-triphosphate receptor type 1